MEQITAALITNYYYFLICIGVFAIGDFIGIFTKAKISSIFVALLIFLVGFLTGVFPSNLVDLAGITEFGKIASGLLVFHMGTMINWEQLKQEWRTVVTTILSMVVVAVAVVCVIPLIGRENAIVAIPVLNGGMISTKIMVDAASEKGLATVAALGMILYAIQKFVGSPPASFFGMKEAHKIVAEFRENKGKTADKVVGDAKVKQTFYQKHAKYFTDFSCIAIGAFFAWVAFALGALTPISYSIWALMFGAFVSFLGIVPVRIMEKGKASGILSMAVFASIIPSLAKIKLEELISLAGISLIIFAAILVGIFVCFYVLPGWKISKSKNLAMGIAMGQLLAFPATFLISKEIAQAVTDDEAEQEAILDKIMPAYVVSGIVSVTILSVFVAGFLEKMI